MEICCRISRGAAASAASAVCAAVEADVRADIESSPVTGNIAMTASPIYFKTSPPPATTPGTTRSKKVFRSSTIFSSGSSSVSRLKPRMSAISIAALDISSLNGARHDPRTRIAPNIGCKKLAVDPPPRRRFENGDECRDEIAKQFDIRFGKAAARVGCPRHRVDYPIREDERRHHIMRYALRPQRCQDREVLIGGFTKERIKPLSVSMTY